MISSGPSAVAAARWSGSSPSSSDPVAGAVSAVAAAGKAITASLWRAPGRLAVRVSPVRSADFIERDIPQNAQLRSERADKPANLADDLLALRPGGQDFADDLGQLDQAGESRGSWRPESCGAVGQLRYPVQDSDGKGLTALRTDGVQLACLLRIDADPALAVPVEMIFSLLGKELDCALQAATRPQCRRHREIVEISIEYGCLSAEHGR